MKYLNNFWASFHERHSNRWQNLMTDQVYPAVLGSIIYMLFDWGYTVYQSQVPIPDTTLRMAFLLVGVTFYLSDFYYIKGSNPYRKWHFFFDLVFMGCMLYSTKLLGVDSKNTDFSSISEVELIGIKRSYMLFLFLYLVWDGIELWNSNKVQRNYYKEVILWESLSILMLFIVYREAGDKGLALLITLIVSTIWFCFLASRKEEHKENILVTKFF